MKSRKTTWCGASVFLGLLLVAAAFMFGGDPETNPDWAGIADAMKALGIGIGGLGAAMNGIFARDDNISSEGTVAKKDQK